MKNSVRLKSRILLTVFCLFLLLSCSYETKTTPQSVKQAVSNIKNRLGKKDYVVDKNFSNPFRDLKEETKKAITKIKRELKLGRRLEFKQVSLRYIPVRIDEYQTFGFDDPANLESLISSMSSYYQGTIPNETVRTYFTDINNLLLNYPLTYSGANQFLDYGVSTGKLTADQRAVLAVELEAILNSTSSTEALDVVNVVNSELYNSQFSPTDANTIYYVNTGVEAAAETPAIAEQLRDDNFRLAGGTDALAAALGLCLLFAAINALASHYYCDRFPDQVASPSYDECMFAGNVGSVVGAVIYGEVLY